MIEKNYTKILNKNYTNDCFAQIEKLNAKLIESEKSRTRFLSILRNELDNPLVAMVSLLSQLAKKFQNKNDEDYEILHLVHMDALKLNFQLSNIIAMASVETGVLEKNTTAFNINSMLIDIDIALSHVVEKKDIKVNKSISSLNDGEVFNDRDKIYIILINIIANAYEYSKPNTAVNISIKESENRLIFSVSNIGEEIKDEGAIFDAFYQQKQGFGRAHQGLGIGLSITSAFVDFLGGNISVTRDGEYNIFTIDIPTFSSNGEVSFYGELDSFMFDN